MDVVKNRFSELYDAQSDAIFRYCLLRTSDREVALDITQDVFVRFWDVLIKEKDVKNDRAFLFTIARNLVIDWYRKKKSFSLDSMMEVDNDDLFSSVYNNTKEDIDLSTEARYVIDKIKDLEPIYHQVIYYRFVENLKPKDIAEILGESPNVISVRINRGMEQLRNIMGSKKDA
ncbi:MAG: sigma-70 family RNA polymerase sigma factor [bacterium]